MAHPADDAQQYNYNLQRLVNDFPQSGILQALLAHTSDEKNLRQASAYFNAKALYKLINAPASLIGVAEEKIIVQNGSNPISYNTYQQHDINTGNAENYFSDPESVETLTAADELPETEHEIMQPAADEPHTAEAMAADLPVTAGNEEYTVAADHTAPAHEAHEAVENVAEAHHEGPADSFEADQFATQTPAHDEQATEAAATETKDEATQEVPLAEPIINYAAGMGHRLPPDVADAHIPPPVPEEHFVGDHAEETHTSVPEEHFVGDQAEETHTSVSEEHFVGDQAEETHASVSEEHFIGDLVEDTHTPPPVPEEHFVAELVEDIHTLPVPEEQFAADQLEDVHTPPPVPEEHLVTDQADDVHTPSPVPEEHLVTDQAEDVHTPLPVSEEYHVTDQAEDVHTPPPGPEEHAVADPVAAEFKDFEEPNVEEHQHTEQAIEEPIQQYRPWDEPAPEEHHEPETIQQPAPEEYHGPDAAAEEPAVAMHHPGEIKEEAGSHDIDDEVYDEISGIEPDIIGSIAATDYFMFDRAFGEHKNPEPVKEASEITEPVNESAGEAEQQDVSKYHDEKMPYSFLWWLDKTRKEHSGIYQPYTATEEISAANTRGKLKAGADELQQQYYENIFHITSVEELDKSLPQPPYAAPPAFEHKKKEQVIIERFIQEEPQIRPQSSDKLDNENKAKKSSEDRDELVSETLAAIYSDQMLYHKAIASYKKLMLRFPEKSRYFAAKIEQLEKKTN